jgi:chaperonin GroEL (HSP60 family)
MQRAHNSLRRASAAVSSGGVVEGFGAAAARAINETIDRFDEAVADVSAASEELVARRRERLLKV